MKRIDKKEFIEKCSIMNREELQEYFNLSCSGIYYYIRHLKVKPLRKRKVIPEELEREVVSLYKNNLTYKQIIENTNISYALLIKILRKNNLRRIGAKAERNEMIVFLSQKYTLTSIGEAFNLSREYIRQVVEKSKG